jgi:hypothetical protein
MRGMSMSTTIAATVAALVLGEAAVAEAQVRMTVPAHPSRSPSGVPPSTPCPTA